MNDWLRTKEQIDADVQQQIEAAKESARDLAQCRREEGKYAPWWKVWAWG